MTQISSERIASIEARRHELAEAMSRGNLSPDEFVRLSKDYAAIEPVAIAERRADIVVIGISTGGPQALRYLVPRMSANFPAPIAIVLHMPVGYTAMYAERLDHISSLDVVEAQQGDEIRAGRVYLAPAGRHLTFVRDGAAIRAHLDLRPFDMQHRPSVDVLFRSAADVYGERVLGVVMTGMGSDGLTGAAHIQARGGRVITEAESSCVVYGMPRAVVEAGISNRVATLGEMASCISEMV